MKRNVSVACVCSAPNCCDTEQRSASNILISGKIIKEMPGPVASGTHCMWSPNCLVLSFLLRLFSVLEYACFPCLVVTGLAKVSNVSEETSASIFMVEE